MPYKINSIKQSINFTTGDPFQTFEIEAFNLSHAECIAIQISDADTSQLSNNTCGGWNGTNMIVTVPNAEFKAEIQAIKVLILANNNKSLPVIDETTITFNTSSEYRGKLFDMFYSIYLQYMQ